MISYLEVLVLEAVVLKAIVLINLRSRSCSVRDCSARSHPDCKVFFAQEMQKRLRNMHGNNEISDKLLHGNLQLE